MRCDCHTHIVGEIDRYAQVPTRTYRAGIARLDDLERNGARRGITRFVLVQISIYGTDNTLLLEGLDTLGGRGRGVVAVDPGTIRPDELGAWHDRGVRGLRLNVYSAAALRAAAGGFEERFAAHTALAESLGWHVEVIAPLALLAEKAEVLARSPVPVVLDHYGLHGRSAPGSVEGRGLLGLLARPHVWMKLSAPYRVSDDPLATRPDPAWLAALLAAAEERLVWGSDWPHTPPNKEEGGPDVAVPYRALAYDEVVDGFVAALDSAERAERIMAENPARLYGFTP